MATRPGTAKNEFSRRNIRDGRMNTEYLPTQTMVTHEDIFSQMRENEDDLEVKRKKSSNNTISKMI